MSIGRIAQRSVDTADAQESVNLAAERMHQRNVGCLVVTDESGRPTGILTDRDLVLRVVAPGKDAFTTLVKDVMTAWPVTCREESPIEEAIAAMRRAQIRRLPVIGAAGQLVGLVTLDDILQLLAEEMASIGRVLSSETPAAAAASGMREVML